MAFSPIVYPPQFHVAGEPASGYWLKAYRAGTSTAIQLAKDRTGNTLVNKIKLNSEGRPEVSGNTIIPHVDQENKLALYPTEAAADADDTNSVIWITDNIDVGSLPASYVDSIDTLSDLRNYSGESRTILLEGGSASGDGNGSLYYYSSGQASGTYTDNGSTIIVPTGGDGSAAWLQISFNQLNTIHSMSQSTSSDDYTRICRIVFDAQNEYANLVLRVIDSVEASADNDSCLLHIRARQNDALSNNPDVKLLVTDSINGTALQSSSFAAQFVTVSASQTIIDVYATSAAGNLDGAYQVLTSDNNAAVITFYDDDGTDTESNITSGTFNVYGQYKPLHSCSQSTSTDAYTRICRIRFNAQAEYTNMVLRVLDGIESTADNDACELLIRARQEAALNSDPVVTLRVRNLDGAGSIANTSFAAYYSTVSATESVIDVYVTSASGNLDAFYQALTINNNGGEITFYDSDGTDTEANITGGTFDVTSQAARGEVVAEGSFSIGGSFSDTGYAKSVRGNGGNWVTVWAPEMTHSSSAAPASSIGDIPAAYRPSGLASNAYGGALSNETYIVIAETNGQLSYFYSGDSRTDTDGQCSVTYFVAD